MWRAVNLDGLFLVPPEWARGLRNFRVDEEHYQEAKSSVTPDPWTWQSHVFRFECINCSLQIKNFGDRGLNFLNPGVNIYSPMAMHIAYGWNTGWGGNTHIGRLAALSSDEDGVLRPDGPVCWLLNSVGDKWMDTELSRPRHHVLSYIFCETSIPCFRDTIYEFQL